MSLAFSDTTNKNGIIQKIEQTLFGENGDGRISGEPTLLAMFTGDVNLAHDDALAIIFEADGRWQFDDSNHTDYPIITTNLVANQRDYPFTVDGSSNLILEIHKVLTKDSASGPYRELEKIDAIQDEDGYSFTDGLNTTGNPSAYDKFANGIFLDPIPSANVTNGLKIYISREGSYFATSDTTKKPGIAGLFHEYYVVKPAYKFAARNGLTNAGWLQSETIRMENAIRKYYTKRAQDEKPQMTMKKINYI